MSRYSIRLRLTAWYALVLLAGLALFGAGMWVALERRLVAGVDMQLAERIRGFETVLEVEGEGADRSQLQLEISEYAREIPEGGLMQVRDGAGVLLAPRTGHPAFSSVPAAGGAVYRAARGHAYRVLTARVESRGQTYDVLVAGSLDEVQSVMRAFRDLLLMLIPGALMVACLGGYWISRRALAPVDEITRVAKSISVQNLARRLRVPNTGDELQRMSETWNEVLERLDVAVKRIRQFTADASHELRTPVAIVRATAELALRRERTTAEYRQSLLDIQREAERMTELTESLLAVARAGAPGSEMPLTPVDLNQVAARVVRESESLAMGKHVALAFQSLNGPAVAFANEAGVRRLLLILIENALRHTPASGSITVSTSTSRDSIVLAVQDTGEGIAADSLPHVFERFYRGDPARDGTGAGLGLSIAQAIAEAHGSAIDVESAPGRGARFSIPLRRGNHSGLNAGE